MKRLNKRSKPPKAAAKAMMSARGYATRRGVSMAAVRKAIEYGRLNRSVSRDERGWYLIDPDLADEEWAASTGVRVGSPGTDKLPGDAPTGLRRPTMDLITAKTVAEEIRAESALIRLGRQKGELVDMGKARSEWFKAGRVLRDAILGIPARVAPQLAASSDPGECELILEKALVEALEELATNTDWGDSE